MSELSIYRPPKSTKRVKSNGYYALYVPDHPNAFGKGYVYEHRYLIEQKIGRILSGNEIVHHIDGNKLNNDLSNLVLCESIAVHKFEHRNPQSHRKAPNELNSTIECACGCGKMFLKYDHLGRERKYLSGHAIHHKKILRQKERSLIFINCECGCGTVINKFDKNGRARRFVSGHNQGKIPNRMFITNDTGLSFATVISYFMGKKLKTKTINLIEQSIQKHYGKDYLRIKRESTKIQ